MKNLCIITARGGSKRIPRKNIKEFFGKPIIAYPIEIALQSNLFSEVMVSTDDDEIAEISKKYGAKIPFMRSVKNSDDYSATADVLFEVLQEYQKIGQDFDNCCCIYPTNPLVTVESLTNSYDLLTKKNFDSVVPVVEYRHCIQKSLRLENNRVFFNNPEGRQTRSQDLEPMYYDGQFYFFNVKLFLESEKLFTDNTGYFIQSELEVQDIDVDIDWKLLEIKYKLLHQYDENK